MSSELTARLISEKFSDANKNLAQEDLQGVSNLALEYKGCSDVILSAEICDLIYAEIKRLINDKKYIDDNGLKVVINNSTNGSLILGRPENSTIFVFNSDEIANNIAAIQSKAAPKNKSTEIFRLDISILFGGDYKGDFNADAVIVQGACNREFYYNIDNEMAFRKLLPYNYFIARSKFLIKDGGVICAIIPSEIEKKITIFAESQKLKIQRVIPFENTKILFFKKNLK